MHDRPRTHDAGLEGDVQRAAGQAIVAQGLGSSAQRHHLGVGGGVVTQDGLVEAAAGDAAVGRHNQCPHGHLAGAAGFLGKSSDPEALVEAVRRIARGLPPPGQPERPAPCGLPHEQLTPREHEMLLLMLSGHPLERIAREMNVSDKTVSNYQTLIRQKLGVASALELIRYGQQHGLMP